MNIQDGPSWAHLSLHRPYGLSLRRPSSAPSRTASTLSRSAVSCQHHLDVSPTNLRVGLAGPPGLKMEIPRIPTTEPELILMPAPPKYLYYWRHLFIVTYIYIYAHLSSLTFSSFFMMHRTSRVPKAPCLASGSPSGLVAQRRPSASSPLLKPKFQISMDRATLEPCAGGLGPAPGLYQTRRRSKRGLDFQLLHHSPETTE